VFLPGEEYGIPPTHALQEALHNVAKVARAEHESAKATGAQVVQQEKQEGPPPDLRHGFGSVRDHAAQSRAKTAAKHGHIHAGQLR
jgi:hypothetical protein